MDLISSPFRFFSVCGLPRSRPTSRRHNLFFRQLTLRFTPQHASLPAEFLGPIGVGLFDICPLTQRLPGILAASTPIDSGSQQFTGLAVEHLRFDRRLADKWIPLIVRHRSINSPAFYARGCSGAAGLRPPPDAPGARAGVFEGRSGEGNILRWLNRYG